MKQCPFCKKDMVEKNSDKMVVMPIHEPGKMRVDSEGNAIFKLPSAPYRGSYMRGFSALCFVCEGCGFIACFGALP